MTQNSAGPRYLGEPTEERPLRIERLLSRSERMKCWLRWHYASLREARARKVVRRLGWDEPVERMQIGERGNTPHGYLRALKELIPIRGRNLAFLGCGNGEELLLGAHYGAASCTGVEHLVHQRAWTKVQEYAKAHYPGCVIRFETIRQMDDLRNHPQTYDGIYTGAVLEHVGDLETFARWCATLLRPGGWLFSVWGPMWWVYSGDHIAAELGFDHGFDHLLLSEPEYLTWYRNHPRNRSIIAAGKPTWLDLGIHCSQRHYYEYFQTLSRHLRVRWRHVIWSDEAMQYAATYPGQVERLTAVHSLRSFEPYLKSAAVVAVKPGDEDST